MACETFLQTLSKSGPEPGMNVHVMQCPYLLQDEDGQVLEAHSISAVLDYPGIGPQHSFHKDNDSISYDSVTDDEALDAFVWLSRKEGIIPAFESSHAIAYLKKAQDKLKDKLVIVNLSGRGDKDMVQAKSLLDFDKQEE